MADDNADNKSGTDHDDVLLFAEMLSKLLGDFEGPQSRQDEQFDRLCA